MNRTGRNTFDKENNHKYLNKKGESQSKRASLIKQLAPEDIKDQLRNSKEGTLPTINVLQVTASLAGCQQMQILSQPLTNTQQYLHYYSDGLLRQSAENGQLMGRFLLNHDIDNQLRARMLDWLIEVCTSYKFQAKTYFSSVHLMDQYFKKQDSRLPISKLHITGVTAMLIASKMDEVYPLKIKTVYQKIVHKKIEKRELIDMQSRIFNKLDYCVNIWSFFDLALLKLHCIHSSRNQKTLKEIQLLCEHIAKFMVFNYELMGQYSIDILADSLLQIACEAYKRENTQSFLGVKQLKLANEKCALCIDLIIQTIKTYKNNFANLKNIFRFGDFSVHKQIDYYLEGH